VLSIIFLKSYFVFQAFQDYLLKIIGTFDGLK